MIAADLDLRAPDGTMVPVRRRGAGTPLVALHGSGGGADSWDPVGDHLPFEVWTPVRRGHARSAESAPQPGFTAHVGDLAAVLVHIAGVTGAESVPVLGGSTGAIVALHLAAAGHPRLGPLVVFEPPLFARGPLLGATLVRYRELLAEGDLAASADLFAAEVARVPPAVRAALASTPPPPPAVARRAAVAFEHDLAALVGDTTPVRAFAAIDRPVLLLQGAETWEPMPDTMAELAAALPSARRVTLAGQSHFAAHTAPGAFAAAVREFLAP